MHVHGGLQYTPADVASAAQSARIAADVGFERVFASETTFDPFLPIALAAGAADIDMGTDIAVAFARNPMTTAAIARDLQALTGGRFILGLGSQVKAHVTRRFSMPWSHPAARMHEFVRALRAIWESWETGARLDFDGRFYHHTLSSPLFDPGPSGHASVRVFVAAVGPQMTEVAGQVSDGLLCHGFTSPSYLAEVTLPALRRGLRAAGRADDVVEVTVPAFLATGPAGADLAPQIQRARSHIAFYGSTPAYRCVLDHHGWGGLHEELHALSVEQRWDEMARLVDDDVLQTFVVVADAGDLANVLRERFGRLVTGLRLNVPYAADPQTWAPVIASLREPAG